MAFQTIENQKKYINELGKQLAQADKEGNWKECEALEEKIAIAWKKLRPDPNPSVNVRSFYPLQLDFLK